MTDSRIQPGAFVWYAPKGTGRVEETGGSPSVLFWADRKSGKTERLPSNLLTPLADYIPEAKAQSKTDEADSWKRFESGVKKAPLKLVALALSACGNSGGTADIRERLARRAPVGPWGNWWKRTEPKLRELPAHFKIDGAGEDVKYILLSRVADVPSNWIEPKVTLEDWKRWLESDTLGQAPGRFPPQELAEDLAEWPTDTIEHTLRRLIAGTNKGKLSSQAAAGWLRAISQASLRWRETNKEDPRGYMAAPVGQSLSRLARRVRKGGPFDLLLSAGALDGSLDAWRRGFLAGMWESFDGEDARETYLKSSAVLGRQAREDLARELFLAAFGPDFSERRYTELDRLLDALSEEQRTQLLHEVVALAKADQRNNVLSYIANSRHAVGSERLALRISAVLMLSDSRGDFAARTSGELADAFATLDAYGPEIQTILKDTLARIAEERALIVSEMEEQRKAHEAELERERRTKERFRTQARELGAEIDALQDKLREGQQSTSLTTGI